eukprot:TRINITY_DN4840_c1_g1_i1.p1 TRINITY_DN4840_c1_g1~~TRINITY_DN4840_c1_g1_i1.p1  ORF type:complete len:335 (-),score=35.66 TRINITY_DN4840_c1_g1_i1:464-1441(-)
MDMSLEQIVAARKKQQAENKAKLQKNKSKAKTAQNKSQKSPQTNKSTNNKGKLQVSKKQALRVKVKTLKKNKLNGNKSKGVGNTNNSNNKNNNQLALVKKQKFKVGGKGGVKKGIVVGKVGLKKQFKQHNNQNYQQNNNFRQNSSNFQQNNNNQQQWSYKKEYNKGQQQQGRDGYVLVVKKVPVNQRQQHQQQQQQPFYQNRTPPQKRSHFTPQSLKSRRQNNPKVLSFSPSQNWKPMKRVGNPNKFNKQTFSITVGNDDKSQQRFSVPSSSAGGGSGIANQRGNTYKDYRPYKQALNHLGEGPRSEGKSAGGNRRSNKYGVLLP